MKSMRREEKRKRTCSVARLCWAEVGASSRSFNIVGRRFSFVFFSSLHHDRRRHRFHIFGFSSLSLSVLLSVRIAYFCFDSLNFYSILCFLCFVCRSFFLENNIFFFFSSLKSHSTIAVLIASRLMRWHCKRNVKQRRNKTILKREKKSKFKMKRRNVFHCVS